MRYAPTRDPPRHRDPSYGRSFGHTLVASALLAAATVLFVVAIVSPITAASVVGLGIGAWFVARRLRRLRR